MVSLLLLLLAQCDPAGPIYSCPSRMVRPDPDAAYAFAFATPTGVGMGSAWCPRTPTGTRGETMTFTRTSAATCTTPAGLVVKLTSGQPRVMSYPGGTQLGLLKEGQRSNLVLRTEEFDNPAWTKDGSAGKVPSVTANAAVAPDGTTTAERIQFPAVGASGTGEYSIVSQIPGPGTPFSQSVWVKGNGTSGTLDLGTYSPGSCVSCSYNATTWTLCKYENVAAGTWFILGNDPIDCGGGARTAHDVFVWGAQMELGAFASSYIPTAGTAATRMPEVASFATPAAIVNAEGCAAMSLYVDRTTLLTGTWLAMATGGTQHFNFEDGSTTTIRARDGTNITTSTVTSMFQRLVQAKAGWRASDNSMLNYSESTNVSGTYDGTAIGTTLYLGNDSSTGGNPYAWIGDVKLNTTRGGCL